jgi:uncharacterized membrane protein YphA (DoxX/SURF4 family)
MSTLGLLARVVLGAVFLVSGVAKLRDARWRESAARFGVPPSVASALPWAEVVLGALLVAQLGVPWVPLVSLGLLGMFTGAVVAHAAKADGVPCNCFGTASTKPVTWATVGRNVVLIALAALALSRR